jgi:two-component system, cell cycle sensor histidine kinase and response regulator CckA
MNAVAQLPRRSPDFSADLRFLFRYASVGLAELQRTGNIIALNPALERMLGILPETGRSFSDVISPDCQAEDERLLRELFEGERHSVCFESSNPPQNQFLRWVAWRVPARDGQPEATLAIVDDRTDPQLVQRLRQAERLEAVGRLAGGVAHDFNNLLTGVLLYCDLLLASIEPGHRVRKYAEEIRNAGVQASALVRQLLALSRPKSSELRLLSLNDIVEGMRNLLVHLIGENIQLRIRLDPELGLVKMDPTQMQQVLLNLVLNARDAMPEGGAITIETVNGHVQILPDSRFPVGPASLPCAIFSVGDTGKGMDAETRGHLFELFFTTKSAGKGSGLGLATVQDIVTSSGGLIHVDSAPQQGTRITVLLPLVPGDSASFNQAQDSSDLRPEISEDIPATEEE